MKRDDVSTFLLSFHKDKEMFRGRIAAHRKRKREKEETRVTKLWILNFAVPNPVAVLFHSRPLT